MRRASAFLVIVILLVSVHRISALGAAKKPAEKKPAPRAASPAFHTFDVWFNVYFWDYKVGYMHNTRRRESTTYAEQKALKLVEVNEMRMRRGAVEVPIVLTDITYLDLTSLRPLARVKKSRLAEGEEVVMEQKFSGRRVQQTVRLVGKDQKPSGKAETSTFFNWQGLVSESTAQHLLEQAGYKVGDRQTYMDFDLDSRQMVAGSIEVKARKLAEVEGKSVEVVVLENVQKRGDKTLTNVMWLDSTGTPVQTIIEELGLRLERTTKDDALDFYSVQDVMDVFRARVRPAIPRVEELTELRLRARPRGSSLPPSFIKDDLQAVEEKEGQMVLTVRRADLSKVASTTLPIHAPENVQVYLKPTLFVQSDDKDIVATARQIVGEETNAWKATESLCRWVFRNVRRKTLSIGLASAKETLRTQAGDCTEHSMLFAALARAVGIPTKLCQGLAYDGAGGFLGHQWNEVYVGDQWIPVDPSTGRVDVGCTYLKTHEWTGENFDRQEQKKELGQMTRLSLQLLSCKVDGQTLNLAEETERRSRTVGGVFIDAQRKFIVRAPNEEWEFQENREEVLFTLIDTKSIMVGNGRRAVPKPEMPRTATMVAESVPAGMTARDYAKALDVQLPTFIGKYRRLKEQPLKVGGEDALAVDYEGVMEDAPIDGRCVMLKRGREILTFMFFAPRNTLRNGDPAFDALVASFRPLDEADMLKQLSASKPSERQVAIVSLGLLKSRQAVDPLMNLLREEVKKSSSPPSPRQRKKKEEKQPELPLTADIVEALGSIGDPRVFPLLESLAQSPKDEERHAAAMGLAGLKTPQAAERLVALLTDENYSVAFAAQMSLKKADGALIIAALEKLGESPDEDKRSAALQGLGALRSEEAQESLLRFLRDPSPAVRAAAVEQLIGWADDTAAPALIAALKDADPEVRAAAAAALAGKTEEEDEEDEIPNPKSQIPSPAPPSVVDALMTALRDNDRETAINAAKSLAQRRAEKGIAPIAALLEHSDRMVRRGAVEALSDYDHADTTKALLRALQDSATPVRAAAVNALHGRKSADIASALARVLSEDPNDDVRAVAARVLKEVNVRRAAEIVAARVRTPSFSPPSKGGEKEGVDVRARAVPLLMEMLTDENVKLLVSLARDTSPQVRVAVAKSIPIYGEDHNPKLLDILALLVHDANPDVQRAALDKAGNLTTLEHAGLAQALLLLQSHRNEKVRLDAARALAKWSQPAALPHLVKLLMHDDPQVRSRASGSLKIEDSEKVLPLLLRHIETEPLPRYQRLREAFSHLLLKPDILIRLARHANPRVRAAACDAIGNEGRKTRAKGGNFAFRLSPFAFLPVLQDRLSDDDDTVRAYALWAWAQACEDEVLPDLLRAAKDKSPQVRRAAWTALTPHLTEEHLPLLRSACEDADPHVRRAAQAAKRLMVKSLREEADEAEAAKDLQRTEQKLQEALRVDPDDVETLCALANLRHRAGRTQEAIALFEQAWVAQLKAVSSSGPLAGERLPCAFEWVAVKPERVLKLSSEEGVDKLLVTPDHLLVLSYQRLWQLDKRAPSPDKGIRRGRRLAELGSEEDSSVEHIAIDGERLWVVQSSEYGCRLWRYDLNADRWENLLIADESVNEFGGDRWAQWAVPDKSGLWIGTDVVTQWDTTLRKGQTFDSTRDKVGSAPVLFEDALWWWNYEEGMCRFNLLDGKLTTFSEGFSLRADCTLAVSDKRLWAGLSAWTEERDEEGFAFDADATATPKPASEPTRGLYLCDVRTGQWMRPADCPHLWTADVHHLVADGESVWALLQPFNVLVHYDPTRRLCRAFLLDLPEDSQQIYGFAVDDKHVYLETGREVWKMGKE